MDTELDVTYRLYLRGDDLQPEVVSQQLGIVPTKTQVRGAPFSVANPTRVSKFGLWSYAREAKAGEDGFAEFLMELEAAVQRAGRPLVELEGVQESWIDVHLLRTMHRLEFDVPDCEFRLGQAEVKRLQALNLPLDVTFGVVRE